LVEEVDKVIVDTYAIVADLTGQATTTAIKVLDSVRLGKVKGVIHYVIVYELSYHWRKGRLPYRDEGELLEFIRTYFDVIRLNPELALEASRIKLEGDKLLRGAEHEELKRRRLSVCDSTTIALALRLKAPVVTGDADLTYVARKMGVEVLW